MIWYFLAGFISGAVGVVMFAHWWIHNHATVIRVTEDDMEEISNEGEENRDD